MFLPFGPGEQRARRLGLRRAWLPGVPGAGALQERWQEGPGPHTLVSTPRSKPTIRIEGNAVPCGVWGDQAWPFSPGGLGPWESPPKSFYSRAVVYQGPPQRQESRKPLSEWPPLRVPLTQTRPSLRGLHPPPPPHSLLTPSWQFPSASDPEPWSGGRGRRRRPLQGPRGPGWQALIFYLKAKQTAI